jgi:hypothetical protein
VRGEAKQPTRRQIKKWDYGALERLKSTVSRDYAEVTWAFPDHCAWGLPKKSSLAKSAQRTSESSPALQCWEPVGDVPQSAKRTIDKSSAGNAVRISRPFHGLSLVIALIPTDKSVGYFQSSASPTFWAKPCA